MPKIHSGIFQ